MRASSAAWKRLQPALTVLMHIVDQGFMKCEVRAVAAPNSWDPLYPNLPEVQEILLCWSLVCELPRAAAGAIRRGAPGAAHAFGSFP